MLSKNQKNFIIGLIAVVVIVLLGLLTYWVMEKNNQGGQRVEDSVVSEGSLHNNTEKLVLGLNKDQYLDKWCVHNSQDPEACVAQVQKCQQNQEKPECQDSFAHFEENWNSGKNPDAYADLPKYRQVDQAVLASFCEDNSGQSVQQCVQDMNKCFAGTSKDKDCEDYIRHFNNETDGGEEYGDIKAGKSIQPKLKTDINSKFNLEVDAKKIGMGSCHMDSCSYSKIVAKNILDSNETSVTIKATMLGGSTAHENGSYPKAIPKNIEWDRNAHDVVVICSYKNPSVILNDQITTLDFGSIPRVDESAAELYFEVCHNNYSGYYEASKSLGYV